jgi:N-acylglucosamine 2-epimerase
MILCNLALEMEDIMGAGHIDTLIPQVVHEVMDVFYQSSTGLILENVKPDGGFSDSFEGRVCNPGHSLEAMWFIMDLGARTGNHQLIEQARDIMLNTLEFGWDKKHGGIFYFLDIKGHPPLQLEWDQKLWWVHVEALVAMAKAIQMTGDQRCVEWFHKLHDYTWAHFKDKEHPEWFGYLNRRGEVLLDLKGGKWKGCFHIPRSLYQIWKTLEKI